MFSIVRVFRALSYRRMRATRLRKDAGKFLLYFESESTISLKRWQTESRGNTPRIGMILLIKRDEEILPASLGNISCAQPFVTGRAVCEKFNILIETSSSVLITRSGINFD